MSSRFQKRELGGREMCVRPADSSIRIHASSLRYLPSSMYQIQFGKGQTGVMPITAENVCPSEVLSEFAADVSTGLSKSQKELPAKYLYDEVGSALFEAITVLPEYGLTRAEERLLGPARWRDRTLASIGRGGGGTGKRKRPQNSTFTGSHCLAAGFRFLLRDRHFTHSSGPLLQSIEWGERCGGAWLTVPVSGGTRGNLQPPPRRRLSTGAFPRQQHREFRA